MRARSLAVPLAAALAASPLVALAQVGDGGAASPDLAQGSDSLAPTVGASLDRAEAHVGDRLTLTVSAIARDAIASSVSLPDKPDLGDFELLDSSRADRDLGDGKKSRRFVLQIAAYETGELELPAVELSYRTAAGEARTVRTTPIPVVIKPVVDDDKADLQPLRAPHDVLVEDHRPMQALAGAAAALITLLLILVGSRVVRRMRRKRAEAPVVVVVRAPEEVALERLAALRARGGFEVDAYRPFHFEVAEVVRAYLGARYRFDGLELTTTELLDELDRSQAAAPTPTTAPAEAPPLPPAQALLGPAERAAIAAFLDACDLVKFAKAPSDELGARRILDAAEQIVHATTPSTVLGSGAAAPLVV